MNVRITTIAAAGAILLASVVSSSAARQTKCSSIYNICLQRAGGASSICEDMYNEARTKGTWRATEEPDGTKHAALPCTK